MLKNPPQCGRPVFDPWVGKIPWRRARQPTPAFLPGESPWTEEPDGLQSMGSQRVRHDWATKHSTALSIHQFKLYNLTVFSILRVEQSSCQSNFRTFYHPPPKIPHPLVVQSLSRAQLLATPWTACSTPGFPVLHYLLKFVQTHVHWISDAIQTTHPSSHSHFPHVPIFSSREPLIYFMSIQICLFWTFHLETESHNVWLLQLPSFI